MTERICSNTHAINGEYKNSEI